MDAPTSRGRFVRITLLSLTALVCFSGCGPKNVRWTYQAGTPQRLTQSKQIVLLADPEIRMLTSVVKSELDFRGYTVRVVECPADAKPAAVTRLIPHDTQLVFALSARYEKRPVPGTRVRVWPWVSVDVTHGQPKEWYILVTEAQLDIKTPATGEALGSVMAEFDKPQEEIEKVSRKLGEGIEEIRRGRRPKT